MRIVWLSIVAAVLNKSLRTLLVVSSSYMEPFILETIVVNWPGPVTESAVFDVFDDITKDQANAALDRIAEGPKEGHLYGLSRRGRENDRWAGTVLMDEFDLNETQAKHILAIWQRNGVLVEVEYHDREKGRPRKGVRVEASKRPA